MRRAMGIRKQGRALGLALLGALALSQPAAAEIGRLAPRHFVSLGNEVFGYVRYLGGPAPVLSERGSFGFERVWNPPLQMTILTRNGQPVSGSDLPAATAAAQAICAAERLDWDRSARGRMLQRGGILFSGACG